MTTESGTRLRRRSFFDSTDPEFSANVASLAEELHGTSSSFGHRLLDPVVGSRSLFSHWQKVVAWMQLQWQLLALTSRSPFQKVAPGTSLASPSSSSRASTSAYSASASTCLPRSYAVGWVWMGSLGLLLFQLICLARFQHQNFHLEVEECQFQAKMLSSSSSPSVVSLASPAAWTTFSRRLGQVLTAQRSRGSSSVIAPWSCMALVPTERPQDVAWAKQLALLLPHSNVLSTAELAQSKSRMQWFIGHHSQAVSKIPSSTTAFFALWAPLDRLQSLLSTTNSIQQLPQVFLAQNDYELAQLRYFRDHYEIREQHLSPIAAAADRATKSKPLDFGILLMKNSLTYDIYDRRVAKHWDTFLHIITPSQDERITRMLLDVWRAHPKWSRLIVRQEETVMDSSRKQLARTRCEQLDPKAQSSEPDVTPQNIDFNCEDMTSDQLQVLKNSIGVHLFPSISQDENQIPFLQSLAVGAVVLVLNSPMIADLTMENCCLGVGSYTMEKNGVLGMPTLQLQRNELVDSLKTVMKMETHVRISMGRAARVVFLSRHTHFLSLLAALDRSICTEDDHLSIETANEDCRQDRITSSLAPLRPFLY